MDSATISNVINTTAGVLPRSHPVEWARALLAPLATSLALAGCADQGPTSQGPGDDEDSPGAVSCVLDADFLVQTGLPKDGIRSLDQPEWVGADHPTDVWFLEPDDRVIAFMVDGTAYAVPHNILWYHEIVNARFTTASGALDLAITYCPLTGSSLVFDRDMADGAEFGVSGLLYKNNLIMYDRRTRVSFWPQMLAQARCGPATGTSLALYPYIEMTWDGWQTLYPDTRVLGDPAGGRGPYDVYPYGRYEDADYPFSYPMPPLDGRRRPKERVLGIVGPDAVGIAFPFEALASLGPWGAIERSMGGQTPAVVLWDGDRRAAAAYLSSVNGEILTLRAGSDGITDEETGSRWAVDGRALGGPLTGARLESVADGYIAFWGAWNAFFPTTELWGPSKPREPNP